MSFSDVNAGTTGTLHIGDRCIPLGNWSFAVPEDSDDNEHEVLTGTFLMNIDDIGHLPKDESHSSELRLYVDETGSNYAVMPAVVTGLNPLTCEVAFEGVGPITLHGTLIDTRTT